MNPPTHTRVLVRFGNMKGEIWVKKGDFWGDLGGWWVDLVCESAIFGKDKKKNVFWGLSLIVFNQ